jgi:hypothetical protein
MKPRKRIAILALLAVLALSAPPALAQGATAQAQGSFSPFPTRLRAAIKDNLVILSWLDSPDVKGRYVVYRHVEAISSANFASATRLGEVPSGAQTYTDTPPDPKPYFYAVFALATDGTPYMAFASAKNVSSVGVSVSIAPLATVLAATSPAGAATTPSASQPPQAAPAATPSSAGPSPAPLPAAKPASPAVAAPAQPFVSALTAKAKGDAIVLTYKASPKSRLVLYRGSTPLSRAADLLDATLVAAFTDKDGSFVDYPVPGVDYYYAILGEEDLKAGRISITAGDNSLSSPAQVRAASVSTGFAETPPASRTPPLPYFLMEDGASGGGTSLAQDDGPPPLRSVSSETEKAIGALLANAPKLRPAMPATSILREELDPPSGGEDYSLSIIVTDKVAAKDWGGATDQLRKYLSLNRGPKASARARFYLGESLVYSGSAREAFFEFLSAREFYPIETKPWIEYVLSTLQES